MLLSQCCSIWKTGDWLEDELLEKPQSKPWNISKILRGTEVGKESMQSRKHVLSRFNRVQLSEMPWTVAHQAPLSMGFSRQEYWSGLPFPSPGDLPDPGIKPESPTAPALQADSLLLSHRGSRTGGRNGKLSGENQKTFWQDFIWRFGNTNEKRLCSYLSRQALDSTLKGKQSLCWISEWVSSRLVSFHRRQFTCIQEVSSLVNI